MSAAKLTRAVMVAAALSLALGACAANTNTGSTNTSSGPSGSVSLPVVTDIPVPSDAANPAGDGKAVCSGVSLAYAGTQSVNNAQLGINILDGVKTAVNAHNAANPGCQVALKTFDTEGDPNKAPGVVNSLVSQKDIIGTVGLAFSGESEAANNIFQSAGLPHITPSATNPSLTTQGYNTFFRGLANDNVQGPAAASLMTSKLGAKSVCVIQDDSAYGIGLATATIKALGSADNANCNDKVTTGQKDFGSTVSKVTNAKAGAVFYSGYYTEAAPLDQQLVNQGYTGPFVAPDGAKDPEFIKLAGGASKNAYFTCACIDGSLIPSFSTAYEKVSNGVAPGTYSVEGYDSATILLKGIDAKNTTRSALLSYVKGYSADGLSKHFQWNATGELAVSTIYAYEVKNGAIVYAGTIS
ncbi:MAG TPA: branched-chain amino acid ABC transporter substrate-binding protein [Pseudonocardiaceae bacterium]